MFIKYEQNNKNYKLVDIKYEPIHFLASIYLSKLSQSVNKQGRTASWLCLGIVIDQKQTPSPGSIVSQEEGSLTDIRTVKIVNR